LFVDSVLKRAVQNRNAAVHGYKVEGIDNEFVQQWSEMTNGLLTQLFKDGHVNESVRKALEKYETYVQQKSALTRIGTDLMT
jgi:hypothetical protein